MKASDTFRKVCKLTPLPRQLDDAPDDIAKAVQVRRVTRVGLVPRDGPHRVRIDDRLDEWFKNECGTCELDGGGVVHAQGFTIETDDEGIWLVANDVMIEE